MKYFKIEKSSNPKVIGNSFPQLIELPKGYNYKNENSIYQIDKLKSKDIADFEIDLKTLKLQKKSILTDFLSCSMIVYGLVISSKVKQILDQFSLPFHKFFKIKIEEYNGNLVDYFILYFPYLELDENQYEKIKFTIFDSFTFEEIEKIEKISKKEFEEIKNNISVKKINRSIRAVELNISKRIEYDLIRFNPILNSSILVSENLKNALEENSLTGLEFRDTNLLFTN